MDGLGKRVDVVRLWTGFIAQAIAFIVLAFVAIVGTLIFMKEGRHLKYTILFGLGAIVTAIVLTTRCIQIQIHESGLKVIRLVRGRSIRWSEISQVIVGSLPGQRYDLTLRLEDGSEASLGIKSASGAIKRRIGELIIQHAGLVMTRHSHDAFVGDRAA